MFLKRSFLIETILHPLLQVPGGGPVILQSVLNQSVCSLFIILQTLITLHGVEECGTES